MKEEEIIQAANEYVGHAEEAEEDLSTYCNRKSFEAGAKWMQEKMIEESCEWIKKLMIASGNYDAYDIQENLRDFKKAMKQ